MRCLRITTSWDDGHPSDLRLADLLVKYGVGGTFYIPCSNSEGRPVLEHNHVREINEVFEVGGHTKAHKQLTSLQPGDAVQQIVDGKRCLEDILGRTVNGFCYPKGGYNSVIKDKVKTAGFEYSRTIKNFFYDPLADPFEIPTTIQFYPHSRGTYLKNFVKHRSFSSRITPFVEVMGSGSLAEIIVGLAKRSWENDGCFHIWGHSWELDEFDLWGQLEEALEVIMTTFDVVTSGSNREIYSTYFPGITL